MSSPNPPREKDDMILTCLRLRQRGQSVYQLAARFGCSPSYVDLATRKVRVADVAESGEDVRVVDAGYRRARKGRAG